MNRNEIESIVRDVVLEFLSSKRTIKKSDLLILLHARSSNQKKVWEIVRSLSHEHQLTLCVSKHWTTIPEDLQRQNIIVIKEENFNLIQDVVKQHKTLVVPTFSYSMLTKLGQTIDDDLHIWIMLQMLLDGKQILVADDEIKLTAMRMVHISIKLKKRIEEMIDWLKSTGICMTTSKDIRANLREVSKSINNKAVVVLEKHIQSLLDEGRVSMKLPKNHVITPMAKDLIRKHQVQIEILE